jgi:thiamine-monophosphate kinase
MLNSILENNFVNTLTAKFSRSPMQKNLLHESDAEIIKLSEDPETYVAMTIDSISEEIEAGLYDDPYLMGWMIVMVNISDLAAVAATPLGIVISEILPENLGGEFLAKLQEGISHAAKACNIFIWGGDTNFGKNVVLSGCALGIFPDNKYLKRKGCKPGDILYSTNKPGIGNAFAISKLLSKSSEKVNYLPYARIKEASILHNYASCCMDTSDGVISTLDQLMRLNNLGFRIIPGWERKLNPESLKVAEKNKLPPWLLLAGEHGEFELLFTIPPKVEKEFLKSAEKENWIPVKLGKVIAEPEIQIDIYKKTVNFNSQKIRNLPFEYRGDIKEYLKSMLIYDRELFNSKV